MGKEGDKMKLKIIAMLMLSIFLGGCNNVKTTNPSGQKKIYQSDYKLAETKVIKSSDLIKELKNNSIKIEDHDLDFGEYSFRQDNMFVNIYTQEKGQDGDIENIQHIKIDLDNEEEGKIIENLVFKSIANLVKEEKLNSWLEDLEDQYDDFEKKGQLEARDEVSDMIRIGNIYASFVGTPAHGYKQFEIAWGDWSNLPEEFKGLAAELENQGLLIIDYTNGNKGSMINVQDGSYYLHANSKSVSKVEDKDASNLVGYRITYNPNDKHSYSSQLYGLIPENTKQPIKTEDMAGIDTVSRVMDMDWDDFVELTSEINDILEKDRKESYQGNQGMYNIEGEVGGYKYKISSELFDLFYSYTVLIEGTVHK